MRVLIRRPFSCRSIEIWENTGVRHSEHLLRQKQMEGGSVLGGGLRFSNTVVLWVTCEQEVLNKRLDNRVDEMLQKGLIAELLDFHDQYNKQRLKWEGCETTVDHVAGERIPVSQSSDLKDTEAREVGKRLLSAECQPVCKRSKREHSSADEDSQDKSGDNACDNDQNGEISSTSISKTLNPPKKSSTTTKPVADYTLGIFQSIGFKEFHDYLILPPQERESEKGMMQYKNGVELLKLVTRRYARRQIKWIKNRFTNVLEREVPRMYALDTTNPSDWDTAVHAPAAAIVKALIAGDAPPPDITPVTTTPKTKEEIMSNYPLILAIPTVSGNTQISLFGIHLSGDAALVQRLRPRLYRRASVAGASRRQQAQESQAEEQTNGRNDYINKTPLIYFHKAVKMTIHDRKNN
ncbi:hypothetical protein HAZT_HAZT006905 [Hyalella azteca]|uniref:Uncharacterized protein n=1 Tax=Hyalella azteca TaxID=294128 RepID=A0A6A0H326_HYAAZ|nr:hypothetical protein HAZT_HAZT006905 [Hyalella azteca]